MSCPYLEKGRKAYCHAFGGEGLGVENSDVEGFCFSGEFSECSFLFSQGLVNRGKAGSIKKLSAGHPKRQEAAAGRWKCFYQLLRPAGENGAIGGQR
jgi:hypothetical protein